MTVLHELFYIQTFVCKYADDTYFVITSVNADIDRSDELEPIEEWSRKNNLIPLTAK